MAGDVLDITAARILGNHEVSMRYHLVSLQLTNILELQRW